MVATSELQIALRLKDDVSHGLDGLHRKFSGLGSALGGVLKVGAIGAGVGIAAATGALISFAKEAAEEEVGIARLQQSIANLDAAHRGNAAEVEKLISQRQKLAYSDDELRDSLSLLIAQTGDYDDALRRQEIAMDLARGTGLDLQTASRLLGKATDENVQVLKRYGINVRDGATATEMLAEVQKRFGGQAAAYANTAAGKWKNLTTQIDNMKETIGAALLPVATRAFGALADLLERHQEEIERFAAAFADKLTKGIEAAEQAIVRITPYVRKLVDGLRDMRTRISPLTPVIKGFVAALGVGAIAAFTLGMVGMAATFITWPFRAVASAVSGVRDFVSATKELVSKTITITQKVVRAGVALIETVANIVGTVTQTVARTGEAVITALADVTGRIIQNVSRAGQAIVMFLADVVGNVKQIVVRSGDKLIEKLGDLTQTIRQKVQVSVDTKQTPEKIGQNIGQRIANALSLSVGAGVGTILGPALLKALAGISLVTVGWAIGIALVAAIIAAVAYKFRSEIASFFLSLWKKELVFPIDVAKLVGEGLRELPRALAFVAGAAAAATLAVLVALPIRAVQLIVDGFKAAGPKVGTAIAGMFKTIPWAGIGEAFSNFASSLPGWIVDAFESLPGILADAGGALLEFARNVPGWLVKAFIDLPNILSGAGREFIRFSANLPGWIGAGFRPIPGIVTGALTGATGMVGIVVQALADILTAIATTPFGQAIGAVMGQIGEDFRAGWAWVNEMTGGALTGIVNQIANIATTMWTLGSNAVNAFWTGLTTLFGWPYAWGQKIVRGIWEGIQSLAGWIFDKVTGFAGGIFDAVRDGLAELWPFSPSKAGVKIGKGLVEGIAEGIRATQASLGQPLRMLEGLSVGASTTVAARGGGSSTRIGHQGHNIYGPVTVRVETAGDLWSELDRVLR